MKSGIELLKSEILQLDGLMVRFHEPMSRHTTFKIGGSAEIYVRVDSAEVFPQLMELTSEYEVRTFLIGNGSNLLFSDQGYAGMVIRLGRDFRRVSFDGTVVECGGGVMMNSLAVRCAARGLSGMEFASGIPGTIGGGLRTNAGAHGRCLSDLLASVDLIMPDGSTAYKDRDCLSFTYRNGDLNGGYVTTARLILEQSESSEIERRMKRWFEERKSKQPYDQPSAGCVFRNPPGGSAGALIDKLGLKGLRIGDAQISEKHANFIVNLGKATASDVLALIQVVKDEVWKQEGVELQTEIQYVA